MKTIGTYTICWLGLVFLAIINGAMREKMYGQFMSELSAHQLSTFIGLILFGIYIYFVTGIFRISSSKQAFLIGCIWLIMTITFEFIFGHYFMGHPWGKLFHDYNLLEGRVWVFVLIWTVLAPYTFYRIRS